MTNTILPVILPVELINIILCYRPKHPIAKILEPEIKICKDFAKGLLSH